MWIQNAITGLCARVCGRWRFGSTLQSTACAPPTGAPPPSKAPHVATAPGSEHGLLDGVLGLIERRKHPIAVDVQLSSMPVGARLEVRLVAERARHQPY